jgi:hypothetical protein
MEKVAGLLAESNARKKNMYAFYFEYCHTFFAFGTYGRTCMLGYPAHITTLFLSVISGHFTRFEMIKAALIRSF